MTVKPIPSFLTAMQARDDLARIQRELYDLQRQTASGRIAEDLKGFGAGAGRMINARTLIADSDARVATAERLSARLALQDNALSQASAAARTFQEQLTAAIANGDGRLLRENLDTAFNTITNALNMAHDGHPLFSGDRAGAPVQARSVADLGGMIAGDTLFNVSERDPVVDIGSGAIVRVADRASTISTTLYAALRDVHVALQGAPGVSPMPDSLRNALINASVTLDAGRQSVVDAQGRNGDVMARVDRESVRLQARADLLTKHLGDVSDADLAEVAMRLSAAQTQYEAAARVFSQLRNLSLVNFLQ